MDTDRSSHASFAHRWWSMIFLAAVVVAVTVLQPYKNGPAIRSDGDGYHFWTYAILKGDLTFSWYKGDSGTVALLQPDPTQARYICKYPPGVALIRLPLMAFVTDPARDAPPYSAGEHWVCLIVSALALLAVALLALQVSLRLGASLPAAHAAVLLLTFGTGLFHYGTYDASFSHVYSALGVALLIWCAVTAVQDRGGRLPVSATLVVVLFLLVRNTNAVLVAFWALAFLVWGWQNGVRGFGTWVRNGLIVGLGVGLGAGVQLALNYHAFGRLQLSSYGDESFDWSRLMLREVLFSYERGVFTYYPILGVALLAGLVVRATRLATAWLGALVLAYALLYGYWSSWFLGCGFGHRGFVELVPFAMPLLAVALSRVSASMQYRLRLAGTLAAWATVLMMYGYWRGTYPMCHATGRHYANHLTLSLYNRVQRVLTGQPRKPVQTADGPGLAPSSAMAGSSSGDAARSTARAPGE